MKVKKKVDLFEVNDFEIAEYIGKNKNGFILVDFTTSKNGVIELSYTYNDWNFICTCLLIPVSDVDYYHIINVD